MKIILMIISFILMSNVEHKFFLINPKFKNSNIEDLKDIFICTILLTFFVNIYDTYDKIFDNYYRTAISKNDYGENIRKTKILFFNILSKTIKNDIKDEMCIKKSILIKELDRVKSINLDLDVKNKISIMYSLIKTDNFSLNARKTFCSNSIYFFMDLYQRLSSNKKEFYDEYIPFVGFFQKCKFIPIEYNYKKKFLKSDNEKKLIKEKKMPILYFNVKLYEFVFFNYIKVLKKSYEQILDIKYAIDKINMFILNLKENKICQESRCIFELSSFLENILFYQKDYSSVSYITCLEKEIIEKSIDYWLCDFSKDKNINVKILKKLFYKLYITLYDNTMHFLVESFNFTTMDDNSYMNSKKSIFIYLK